MSKDISSPSRVDLVIKGDVVLPERVIPHGYIAVSNGRVVNVDAGTAPDAAQVEDFAGCLLFPGLVDAQIHAGSIEGFKGLEDATRAAAAGGVTTVIDMPFDEPTPVNTLDLLERKIEAVHNYATVDVGLYVTARKDGNYAVLRDLVRAGACSIKLSTYEYHPIRFPRFTTGEMYEIFLEAKDLGVAVAFHNEDQELVNSLIARAAESGKKGMEIHGVGRAPIAELVADAQILELAANTGVRCHIVHSTIAAGNRIALRYREQGAKITVESCVHYLVFNEGDAIRQGAFLKLNPPIRAEAERQELWRSLVDGEIDLISTDHVAWPISRKSDPDMAKNGSGIPGLETLLAAFFTGAVKERSLSPTLLARLMAENPAKHFGFYPRKGALRAGADADIAVFCPKERVFATKSMVSAVKWSPYAGMSMAGFVRATFVRGRKIFEDGQVIVNSGVGQFVRPTEAPV